MAYWRSAKSILWGCLTVVVGAVPAGAFDGVWYDTLFQKEWIVEESAAEILVRFEPAATVLERELLARQWNLRRPYDARSRTEVLAVAAGARAAEIAARMIDHTLVRDAVAARNNDLGISGIAPSCRIMPLRVDRRSQSESG